MLAILLILLRGVVWFSVGCFFFMFVLLVRNTFLPRYPYEISLEKMGLPGEEVHFKSRDGLLLSGTLLISKRENPWMVLCHGVGANRYDLIGIAKFLYDEGSFNLFLFDFRGHGKSKGWATSFGYHEQKDLLGALDYLDGQKETSHRYGLYGISMGASVGILVAVKDPRILALCLDSPFVDLAESMAIHFRLLYPLPKFPFLTLAYLSYNIRFLTDIRQVSPIHVVHHIAPRPLFIINGSADDRMTSARARALYEKAHEPKRLWLIPGAGHLEGMAVAPTEYQREVLRFFRKALAPVLVEEKR